MFTLAIVALLMTGPEWAVQKFDSPEECIEAGLVIAEAYYLMQPNAILFAECTHEVWL